MGDFKVNAIASDQERTKFYSAILNDLEAFDQMLKEDLIEQKSRTIGAEQEMCIIDSEGQPKPSALEILSEIDDERYTNEIALFDLEANLNPRALEGHCFRLVEEELKELYQLGRQVAHEKGGELFLTGILPTIHFRHLMFDYMTPEKRYRLLSEEFLKLRGRKFEIFLQGVDDLHAALDSVLFEACNTSFQMHLQVAPNEFSTIYNWSQMIAGPVLAACTNSPLVFGKELWEESRIALFKQSLDTRGQYNHSLVRTPRVYFGDGWLEGSAIELWKKDVVRFPALLQAYADEDPRDSLKKGIIPDLKSIQLHNGTTYTWNRLCYGVADNSAHIRIECRYIPAGPSRIDEIANFAFWIGLMKSLSEEEKDFWREVDFREAKNNFIKAARYGMHSVLHWFGKNYAAKELILKELLPMARKGLEAVDIVSEDIDRYLSIIEDRVKKEQNGSEWLRRNYRTLSTKYKPNFAQRLLVQRALEFQLQDLPVHRWENFYEGSLHTIKDNLFVRRTLVEDIMTKNVYSVKENISVEVMKKVFDWKNFKRHLPIENLHGDLVGIVSKHLLDQNDFDDSALAKEVMVREVITIAPTADIEEAKALMETKEIGCLPVVEQQKLVGIITRRDLRLMNIQKS